MQMEYTRTTEEVRVEKLTIADLRNKIKIIDSAKATVVLSKNDTIAKLDVAIAGYDADKKVLVDLIKEAKSLGVIES
jgi:hypothetical protein